MILFNHDVLGIPKTVVFEQAEGNVKDPEKSKSRTWNWTQVIEPVQLPLDRRKEAEGR
jgi:hypothetical protein